MADAPGTGRRWNLPVLIVGAILALGAFAASYLIGGTHPSSGTPQETSPIVVAARDLDARSTLAASDLTVVRYATADIPPGALSAPGPAVGQVVQAAIRKGQPVLANLVAKPSEVATPGSGQPAFLPLDRGLVATTLPTAELTGVADFIRPGDYIDVIAVVSPKGATSANVRTIYSGIHVIKVGTAGQQSATPGSGGSTSSITVAVTQCQAEFLSWFLTNANLKYTLLSAQDYAGAAAATPDTTCPASGAVKGVVETDIKSRWPGLAG